MPCSAYTCLDVCKKNHLLIFSSFLDIWENVKWPRFFGPPCILLKQSSLIYTASEDRVLWHHIVAKVINSAHRKVQKFHKISLSQDSQN